MEKRSEEKFALLLVDDEYRIRSALKRLFFKEPHQRGEAGNGQDAPSEDSLAAGRGIRPAARENAKRGENGWI